MFILMLCEAKGTLLLKFFGSQDVDLERTICGLQRFMLQMDFTIETPKQRVCTRPSDRYS